MNHYNNIRPAELLELILRGDEQSDEVMYYVLTERLYDRLKSKHNVHNTIPWENFDDEINDFFLYLRESKSSKPFQILSTIKNSDTFDAWIVNTFRNFLTVRVSRINKTCDTKEIVFQQCDSNDRERLFSNAATLIAYSHQELEHRNQFILLRTLLSLLDKSKALPDSEMAEAMGMSYTLYRVTTHRIMQYIKTFNRRIESGETPNLDAYHKAMAENIYNDFDTLYPTLIGYYNETLVKQDKESSITALRKRHCGLVGYMAHENPAPYGHSSAWKFYIKLYNMEG